MKTTPTAAGSSAGIDVSTAEKSDGPLGSRLTDVCPNCCSPWKCNGPHIGEAPGHEYEDLAASPTQTGEERAAQDDPRAKILGDIEELSSRFDWRMSPDKHGNHSIGHEEIQRLLLDLKLPHKAVAQLPVVATPSPEDDATVRVPRIADNTMLLRGIAAYDRETGTQEIGRHQCPTCDAEALQKAYKAMIAAAESGE